ncbi:MAG: FtsW/RodA/SpoVE family cell cycle protein [Bacteroidales bacterium]|nr:FtsW/RodA/SpoVE family cell cycle protein [Bacteroidales bacterium]
MAWNRISNFISENFFKGDKAVWMIYFFLCMISLVEIYSASSNLTFKSGHHWAPMISQAGFLIAGFVIILIVHRIPCKYFKLLPLFLLPLAVVLLICTKLMGGEVNNAQRWMKLGQFTFQPSEIAKSAVILTLAFILSKSQTEIKVRTKHGIITKLKATNGGYSKPFKMCSAVILLVCALICTENFSTAAILFTVSVAMMFIGNIPNDLMLKGIGVIAAFGVVAVMCMCMLPDTTLASLSKRAPTWKARIVNKISPESVSDSMAVISIQDAQKQETSALIAVANSNVIGRGPGNSEERDFLYRAESDFIYAIIIEELGIIGGLFVLILYVVLLIRVGKIAQKCDRFFPAYLVLGLGMIMVLQALINMGVAVGMLPVTGQTLPLISKGGTSILITSFNIGMILSVSRYADKVSETRLEPAEEISSNETNEYFSSIGME